MKVGTPCQTETRRVFNGVRAKIYEARRYDKNHRPRNYVLDTSKKIDALKLKKHIADGSAERQFRHVLMDYSNDKQLKSKMMTRLEAWDRNRTLRGLGFAWALCSK